LIEGAGRRSLDFLKKRGKKIYSYTGAKDLPSELKELKAGRPVFK
jgi:hypothetical protein